MDPVALQSLRKTKSGGRNGGRPRINPPKPPRTEPFDRVAHLAKMRAAKAAKAKGFGIPSSSKLPTPALGSVAPAACIGGNPTCPCQDGDMCHYKGPNPWPIPTRALGE